MRTKEKKFVWISLLYIAYLLVPLISSMVPVAIVSIAVSASLYILYPSCFKAKYCQWFWAYFGVLLFYCIIGHPFKINGIGEMVSFRKLMIETAWILPNIMICSIIVYLNDVKIFLLFAKWILIILSVSLLMILPVVWTTSGILRENIRVQASGGQGLLTLPSYTLMSCYSFFVPALGYGYKKAEGRLKWIFLSLIILFIYFVYKTEITTSLLAAVFTILFIMVYQRGGNEKNIIAFLISASLLLLANELGYILNFVDWLIDIYEGTVAQVKIIEFKGILMGEDESGGNVQLRESLRERSFNSFLNNPLIGSSDSGEHSSIMDRLGTMGLLGWIPFMMMLYTNVRMWWQMMPEKNAKWFYLVGIIIISIFLYAKGLFSGEGMLFLFVLLPVSIIGIYYYTKNVSKSPINWNLSKCNTGYYSHY